MGKDILLVQGPEKTGTSTITGILNCHPEIFILFENYMAQPLITKYGNQLLDRYPEARKFFRTESDYGLPIKEFFQFLEKKEPDFTYRYVGTKINSLNPNYTQREEKHRIIFMMRDIKTWLVKENIINRYRTDLDVVIPTIEYLSYTVNSFKYNHAHHIWMEDLIERNDECISGLSSYLDIPLKPYTDLWWEKIANRDEENPKSVFRLNHVHHSSRCKPRKLDTSVTLMRHPFWETVYGIFDNYYRKEKKLITDSQINDDLMKIKKFAPIGYEECYSSVHSVRIGDQKSKEVHYLSGKNKKGEKRSIFSRLRHKINRIIKFALNELGIKKRG